MQSYLWLFYFLFNLIYVYLLKNSTSCTNYHVKKFHDSKFLNNYTRLILLDYFSIFLVAIFIIVKTQRLLFIKWKILIDFY